MKDLLYINKANDYATDIGAPIYHPHISVIHYDEAGYIRHSLNHFHVYAIFAQKNFPDELTYGVGNYTTSKDALVAYAPGQIGGKADDGTVDQYHGWALLFDPEFMHGTEFEHRLNSYSYFSYNSNEALKPTAEEMATVDLIMSTIRSELQANQPYTERIVQDYILLLADLCCRFYGRQVSKVTENKADILARFQRVLQNYYAQGLQQKSGLPSVKHCASALFMSPSYFGDVIRKALGQSPLQYIHTFIIDRSKELIASGKSVTEVAYSMGFEYPQHFSRLFKKTTGIPPSQYLSTIKKR